jgi:endothelin-converting enzyme
VVCYGFSEHGDDNESTIRNLQKRNSRIMRKILESPSYEEAAGYRSTLVRRNNNNNSNNVDEHNFDMLRKGYQACMDMDAIEAAGIKPLTDMIVSINKTWPVSPNDLLSKVGASEYAGLSKAILFLENMAISPFRTVSQVVIPDPLSSVSCPYV